MAVITLPFASLASVRRAPTSTELTNGLGCGAFDVALFNELNWLSGRVGWLTINGVSNAPPGSPVVGAYYLIGSSPTGDWATHAGKVAQWDGNDWVCFSPPIGFIVADNSKAENDTLRYLKLGGGGWITATASDVAFGFARAATAAELLAASGTGYVTASNLASSFRVRDRLYTTTAGVTTWTRPAWCRAVLARVVGGGGGGAGAGVGGAGDGNAGGGGGSGGFAEKFIITPPATITLTVGAGGAGHTFGNNPTAGGTTSLGSIMSATGGQPGIYMTPAQVEGFTAASSGGVGVGGDINIPGGAGQNGYRWPGFNGLVIAGIGGAPPYYGRPNFSYTSNQNGSNGLPGHGGSGAVARSDNSFYNGGNGGSGIIEMWMME